MLGRGEKVVLMGSYILSGRSMSLLELWDDDVLSLLPKSEVSGVLYRVPLKRCT
jgi:hypothetical protein